MRLLNTWIVAGVMLAGASDAFALTVLKQIQTQDQSIELQFDQQINANQIKVEYFRDIIQLSIKDISVYPPKVIPVQFKGITKIFAYQYTPDLIRCRFSVNGQGEDYKEKFSYQVQGQKIIIQLNAQNIAQTDKIQTQVAKAVTEVSKKVEEKNQPVFENKKANNKPSDLKSSLAKEKQSPIAQMGKAFAYLIGTLIFLVLLFISFKKILKMSQGSSSTWLKKMIKFKLKSKAKMIEVVSSHYLGPKKSIAVVKVQGRHLVLGITEESINLITQLSSVEDEFNIADVLEEDEQSQNLPSVGAMAAPAFSELLKSETKKPFGTRPKTDRHTSSVRNEIRKKIEGLKTL